MSTWTPRRAPGTWRYEMHTRATVSLSTDTGAAPVPIDTRSFYTLSIGQSDSGFMLTGSVDSVATHAGPRIPAPPSGTRFPMLFSARLEGSGVPGAIQSTSPAPCRSGVVPMLAAVGGLLPALPLTIQIGSSWQDTVVSVACRGDIALRTTTTSRYRLSDTAVAQGRAALLVEQSFETSTASDSAAERQKGSVSITGTGKGQRELYVDPVTGALLQAQGESKSVITVRTRSTALPFQQAVKETITLRP
ncbi:MAG: hypothetical protein ACREOJ_02145 [Gemmatimonadaceae bacterium]